MIFDPKSTPYLSENRALVLDSMGLLEVKPRYSFCLKGRGS